PLEDPREGRLRIGVAGNFTADEDVTRAFTVAVDTVRGLGHQIVSATAPFDLPRFGDSSRIKTDRETIADRAFKAIDLLLLPTTTTTVPTVEASRGRPQALSAANTMFANYFGLPAISMPCGVDRHDLPVGLQIIGKPWSDRTVLRLAQRFDASTAGADWRSLTFR